MRNPLLNKKTSLFIYAIGFITAVSICIYTFIIYQSSKPKIENGPSFSVDSYSNYDAPYDVFLRFLIVAILFLLSGLLMYFAKKTFLQIVNILVLAVVFFLGCLTLKEPISIVLYEDQKYLLSGLAVLLFFGTFIISPTIILIGLQIHSLIKKNTAF